MARTTRKTSRRPAMLQLENVSLQYGAFKALHEVSLHANEGELVVLLGANGAGKSSIFLTVSGLLKAAGGRIRLRGQDVAGAKPSRLVEQGLVLCPEGRKLFPGMSVLKNLMLGAYVHRRDRKGNAKLLDEVFDMFPILREKKDDAAGSLSGGQQQMVAIGRALMGRPKALLLDEPSLGLAPLVVKQVLEVIQRINRAGTTVLLAEQNAYAALQIAHRAYVLEGGRIVMEGSRDELLNNDAVRRAYIGA
jgi:branched-chain amino acid transport system ATP-binding protein